MSKFSEPAPGPHLDPAAPGQPAGGHPHLFVQAPVPPLDVDGLTAVVLGLIAFAVASVVLGVLYPRLVATGDQWWLGVALSGFALGLVGLAYGWNRRHRRRAGP